MEKRVVKIGGSALARELGVSPSLISQMRAKGFADEEIRERAGRVSRGRKKEPPTPGNFHESQARKEAALAQLRELELAEKEQKLVDVDLQAAVWSDVAATLRDNLLGLPDKIADQLAEITDPREVRVQLMKHVRELLSGLPDKIRVVKRAA